MLPIICITWTKNWIIRDKLQISEFKKRFDRCGFLTAKDILSFYRITEPDIPHATVRWRIHKLTDFGIITRVGRGKYIPGKPDGYKPELSRKIKAINKVLKENLPYLKYCIWESNCLVEFSHHVPRTSLIMVDAEKDTSESVFNLVKDQFSGVYHKSLPENFQVKTSAIIIRLLISEAPIQIIQKTPTVTLEKLLVDALTDIEFEFIKGAEIQRIFENALDKYPVNLSKILRYADRKRKKKPVLDMIKKFKKYEDILQNK